MLLIFNDLGPCGSPKPIHVLIVQIVSTNYNYISRTVHNLSDIPRFFSVCPRVVWLCLNCLFTKLITTREREASCQWWHSLLRVPPSRPFSFTPPCVSLRESIVWKKKEECYLIDNFAELAFPLADAVASLCIHRFILDTYVKKPHKVFSRLCSPRYWLGWQTVNQLMTTSTKLGRVLWLGHSSIMSRFFFFHTMISIP